MARPGWRIVGWCLLAGAFFIGFFNRFAPAAFAPPIVQRFDLGAARMGSLAAMHFWVYTLMQIPTGTLLTGAGALTLGLAPDYAVALAGPALVGLGMSFVFVAVMKHNATGFAGRRFGLATRCSPLVAALGSIAAEAPAHALLRVLAWRTIFIRVGGATIAIGVLIALF